MAVLIWALALRTLDLGDQSILLGRMSKRLSRFNAVGNEHEWMYVLLDVRTIEWYNSTHSTMEILLLRIRT